MGEIEREGEATKNYKAHVLLLPYPTQGHINPILQFSKRLAFHGLRVTLAITRSAINTTPRSNTATSINDEEISDGYDTGGFFEADSIQSYLARFEAVGSKTLAEAVNRQAARGNPVDFIVYDSFLPWALDVAKGLRVAAAVFFTQPCTVDAFYYHACCGRLQLPLVGPTVEVDGLPVLKLRDAPSMVVDVGHYGAYLSMLLNQFSNIDGADAVLFNTVYELEVEIADWFAKRFPSWTIGPTIPSIHLDKRIERDEQYGFDLFAKDNNQCAKWLDSKQNGSVIYVAFGSLAVLGPEQMEEIAYGLRSTDKNFLWVVRASETQKLPPWFTEDTAEKGLVVVWCTQIEVLAHPAVGCFVTHCGWNSTLEALSLGVPMVAVPQWTDQPTNAKLVEDMWGVGVRAKADDKGLVTRQEIESCIEDVMEGESGERFKKKAGKLREVMVKAVSEGGSTDRGVQKFVDAIINANK